jgi:hypothetical protein
MDSILSLGFKPSELETINRGRLFFQVTLLSNIVHPGMGRTQVPPYFTTYHMNSSNISGYISLLNWPTQPRPDSATSKLWLSGITRAFHIDIDSYSPIQLQQWIHPLCHINNLWNFYSEQTPTNSDADAPLHTTNSFVTNVTQLLDNQPNTIGTLQLQVSSLIHIGPRLYSTLMVNISHVKHPPSP